MESDVGKVFMLDLYLTAQQVSYFFSQHGLDIEDAKSESHIIVGNGLLLVSCMGSNITIERKHPDGNRIILRDHSFISIEQLILFIHSNESIKRSLDFGTAPTELLKNGYFREAV